MLHKEAQTHSLCYKEAQTHSLCYTRRHRLTVYAQTHSLCYKEAQTHSLCYTRDTDSQSMLHKEAQTHSLWMHRLTVYATISIRNGISICNTERPLCSEQSPHLRNRHILSFFPCQFRVFFRVSERFFDLKEESYLNRPRALN